MNKNPNPLHPLEGGADRADAIAIYHYDVVIVGGGIAGIAVAEFLSRETKLHIKVIDEAPQLGTGASGKLEGWFHSGALYSGNDDHTVFMNCVNVIQDLINFYSSHFPKRCNMALTEKSASLHVPAVVNRGDDRRWFNDAPVHYILPNVGSPEIKLSKLKNDRVLWQIQRTRVLNRLEATFGKGHSWLANGKCQAPSYENIEKFSSEDCSLMESPKMLEEFCKRHDATFGVNAHCDVLKSADVSMNTSVILHDLICSALANGVHFETSVTIDNVVIDAAGSSIKSLLCRDRHGRREHVKAKLFIFAVGSGFETLLQSLRLNVKVTINKSAMVIASPPLSQINFSRMSPKQSFHFNHFAQHGSLDGTEFNYSVLANSRFWREQANWREHVEPEQITNDTDSLLETAERYFGEQELYSRKLYSYDCFKSEFISEEEEKRRYSYWIEFNKNTNYICILPGKFSFFPTVAYQTYLKVKDNLGLSGVSKIPQYSPNSRIEKMAKELLAVHRAVKILSADSSEDTSIDAPKKKYVFVKDAG